MSTTNTEDVMRWGRPPIPPSRIDEVDRNFQWGELMTPDSIREPLIELIRSVNELAERLDRIERRLNA